jgi:hypothetical protein
MQQIRSIKYNFILDYLRNGRNPLRGSTISKNNQIIVITPPVDRIGATFSLLKCLARVNPAVVLLALLLPP